MRDAEADIAEALSNEGWLTVLDGPLHGIRHRRPCGAALESAPERHGSCPTIPAARGDGARRPGDLGEEACSRGEQTQPLAPKLP